MYTNVIFQDWEKLQIDRKDIGVYIGDNISIQKIEIFMNILYPNVIEYNDCILKVPHGIAEVEKSEIKNLFHEWYSKLNSLEGVEKIMNYTSVRDIFYHDSDNLNIELSTWYNVSTLIKNNWEWYLSKLYPQKKIEVLLIDDEGEIYISFYQNR